MRIIKGGQGRSDAEIRDTATAMMWIVALAVVWVILIAVRQQ
jgi:hypothetical protein